MQIGYVSIPTVAGEGLSKIIVKNNSAYRLILLP
jgi:hypothetical protein